MWQIQIVGAAQNAFSYQLLASLREALQQHPNEEVRSLQDVETKLHVRVVLGGPPAGGGRLDVDGIGVQPWRTTLYVAGSDFGAGLELVRFVLEHKVQKERIPQMPRLRVQLGGKRCEKQYLPPSWQDMQPLPSSVPGAFEALPPRGRRHVVCQLEWVFEKGREGNDADVVSGGKYVFTVLGGLYPFRAFFDEKGITGAQLESRGSDKVSELGSEYIRFVEFQRPDECASVVGPILVDCLKGVPVYFVNMVSAEDAAALWILQHDSVESCEDAFQV